MGFPLLSHAKSSCYTIVNIVVRFGTNLAIYNFDFYPY